MRHPPTEDCTGEAVQVGTKVLTCRECRIDLCACELAYGHDCEE